MRLLQVGSQAGNTPTRGGKETTVGIKRRNWRKEDGVSFFSVEFDYAVPLFCVGGRKKKSTIQVLERQTATTKVS